MPKWLLLVAVAPFLLACASTPSPESPQDSLVIGYFALDFPDGYFDQSRRTITSGVTLNFVNQTTGRKFWTTTENGYFQFLSNGTDSYQFASYKIRSDGATVGSAIDMKFTTKPRSVVYLGHLTLIYSKPKSTHKTSLDAKTNYWNFETSANFLYNEGELRTYLQGRGRDSPWLEYEVVRAIQP